MTVKIAPHVDIKTGSLVDDSSPAAVAPGVSAPQVVVVEATKENIQDYVADMMASAPHVNMTATYNDETNQLVFTVDPVETTINNPDDILDFTSALDAGLN